MLPLIFNLVSSLGEEFRNLCDMLVPWFVAFGYGAAFCAIIFVAALLDKQRLG